MAAGGFGLREHCVRPSRAKAGEISCASGAARSTHEETSDSLGDCRATKGRMVLHGRDYGGVVARRPLIRCLMFVAELGFLVEVLEPNMMAKVVRPAS